MADAWMRTLRGNASVGVASAGIVGGTAVKEGAITVMGEVGIDISKYTSDAMAGYSPEDFDVVISCCGCGGKLAGEQMKWKQQEVFEDWNLDDPPAIDPGDLSAYRRVRDELRVKVQALLDTLGASKPTGGAAADCCSGSKPVCVLVDGTCLPLDDMSKDKGVGSPPGLLRELLAEAIGTMMIVLFGCGSVCASLSGAYMGVFQVASVWGIGVALAIYCTTEISGAHLNPAVTLAFWLVRPAAHKMNLRKALLFMAAQLLGGIIGGAMNFAIYHGTIAAFERDNWITRGAENSTLSAKAFGEYFPDPGLSAEYTKGGIYHQEDVTVGHALFTEAWGTFILCFVIFSVTHARNPALAIMRSRPSCPVLIGATVALLLALYAPITQAGWNPARDFGPRIIAALAGWGTVAIPGPRNGFWIYIVGPYVGGPLGAAASEFLVFGKVVDELEGRVPGLRRRV